MNPASTTAFAPHHESDAALTIRMAVPADARALGRLAQLDSASPPKAVPILVAEVGGDLMAALPLDGGRAIANPFRRTAELVTMLAARSRQLQTQAPDGVGQRWRPLRAPTAAASPRS
jgi:hypothetical protein